MGNHLQCPICERPKFYTEDSFTHGLRYHLEQFHKRNDFMELIELARNIAKPITRTQHINEVNALRSQNKLK